MLTLCMFFFFFFGCTAKLTGILVPQPGIEPGLLAQSPNHWIARKLPHCVFMVVLKVSRQKWLWFFVFFLFFKARSVK